ncbi:hypothetical protein SAMN05421644_13424 [Allochromatium warmingii]|uniref:Uncharacterized protein n=1 Tax=Allochromatium warmingii TaxID=61595 RepID=A0A1H3HNF2_ALLWA|nr:hypothetical protein [Allochromatium warmingii]SDY16318.1 hypothetical protein SAMN05421644_13424 [Allochromatium warmingii]
MTAIITDSFTHNYHACDQQLAAAQKSLTSSDWALINHATQILVKAINYL